MNYACKYESLLGFNSKRSAAVINYRACSDLCSENLHNGKKRKKKTTLKLRGPCAKSCGGGCKVYRRTEETDVQ